MNSLTLVRQTAYKEKSELTPEELTFKIDLESPPTRGGGLVWFGFYACWLIYLAELANAKSIFKDGQIFDP